MSEEGDIPSVPKNDNSAEPNLARRTIYRLTGKEKLTKENKALNLKISHLEDEINTKSTTISNLTEKAEERQGEIDQCKESNTELKCQLTKMESEAKAKSNEIEYRKENEMELKNRISQLEDENKSKSAKIEKLNFRTTEMTLRARFTEISKLTSTRVFSQWTEFAGVNWRIFLYKTDDHLSFYVEAQNENAKKWSCAAFREYQLISQKDENIVHRENSKGAEVHTAGRKGIWGYDKFISFKDLFDEEKGYVKDDSILVAAVIKAFPNAIKVTAAVKN